MTNDAVTGSYIATGAGFYARFYSVLPPSSSALNKTLTGVQIPYRIHLDKLDKLAGKKYVTFHVKRDRVVVSNASTSARHDSDYQAQSTMRQVKDVMDGLRDTAEPFLGEGLSGAQIAALEGALSKKVQEKKKGKVINGGEIKLLFTPQSKVLGQGAVEVKLIPSFELRQLTFTVALSAT